MSVYDSSSVPVADIKGLLTGKDCPHMKENKGKQNKVNDTLRVPKIPFMFTSGGLRSHCVYLSCFQEVLDLAFSITYDVEEYSLNFIAPSRTDVSLALNFFPPKFTQHSPHYRSFFFSVSFTMYKQLNWRLPLYLSQFCLWTDGLSVLLGREMSSESMRSELEILLSMEIKLRLLDLENVPIPECAPVVPKPPSNYNFCYDFSQTEQ